MFVFLSVASVRKEGEETPATAKARYQHYATDACPDNDDLRVGVHRERVWSDVRDNAELAG